jgi:hypothetical protein
MALFGKSSKYRKTPALILSVVAASAAALASPAAALAAHAPPARSAAGSAVAGYVWTDGITPQDYYDFDSADNHPGSVTVSSPSTGLYTVDFAHLGSIASSANFQVTPYDTDDSCAVTGWATDGRTGLQAAVACYGNPGGTLADSEFDLVVTKVTGSPRGTFDYSYVYKDASSGLLTANQYNSAHKKNSVRFLGTGRYQVLFPGPATTGTRGVVKVTAYGAEPGDCELNGWKGSPKGELVNVDCYDDHFHFQNRKFLVTYAATNSLLGINGQVTANAFADSKAAVYQPPVQFNSVKNARITVVNYGPGAYEVLAAGSSGNDVKWGGDVQVSAVGNRGRHCYTYGWDQQYTPAIDVECSDRSGHETDTPFTVEWVVP